MVSDPVSSIAKGAVVVVAVAAIAGMFIGMHNDGKRTAEAASESSAASEQFQRVVGGAMVLRKSMRDPDSFELSDVVEMPDGQTVCYEFRARNGFGGMDGSAAVLSHDRFRERGQRGFSRAWQRFCAGRHGNDMTDDVVSALHSYEKMHPDK